MPKVAQPSQLRFDQLVAAIVFVPATGVTNYNYVITDQAGVVVLSLDNTSATPINGTPYVGIKLADMVQSKPVIAGSYTISVVSRAINQGDSDSDPVTIGFSLNAGRAAAIERALNPAATPPVPPNNPQNTPPTNVLPIVPTVATPPLAEERNRVRWFLMALACIIVLACIYFWSGHKTVNADATSNCQDDGSFHQTATMGNIGNNNVFHGPVNCNFAFPATSVSITNIWTTPAAPAAQPAPGQQNTGMVPPRQAVLLQETIQTTYGPPVFIGGSWCVSLGFGRGWMRCDDPRSGYQFNGHVWEHRAGWSESERQRFDFRQDDRGRFRFGSDNRQGPGRQTGRWRGY